MKVAHAQLTYIIIENIPKGNVDDDTVFTFDAGTEVYKSCAATLNDEFWVIGGYERIRQVFMRSFNNNPLLRLNRIP